MGKESIDNNNPTGSAPQSLQPAPPPDCAPTQSTLNVTPGSSTISRMPSPEGTLADPFLGREVQFLEFKPFPQPVYAPILDPRADEFQAIPLNEQSVVVSPHTSPLEPPPVEQVKQFHPFSAAKPDPWKSLLRNLGKLGEAWDLVNANASDKGTRNKDNESLPSRLNGLYSRIDGWVEKFGSRGSLNISLQEQEQLNEEGMVLVKDTFNVASQITTAAAKGPLAEQARLLPLCGKVILRGLAIAATALAAPVLIILAAVFGVATGIIATPIFILENNKNAEKKEKLPYWLCIPVGSSLFAAGLFGAIAAKALETAIKSNARSIGHDVNARRSVRELEAIAKHLQGEIVKEPSWAQVTQGMADKKPQVAVLQF
jgi:hypothetical protein